MSTCLTPRETNRGKQTLRVNSLACHSASFSLIFSSTLSPFFAILHRSYLPTVFLLSVIRRFRFHRSHPPAPLPVPTFSLFLSLIHNENYSESVNACRDNRIYRPRQWRIHLEITVSTFHSARSLAERTWFGLRLCRASPYPEFLRRLAQCDRTPKNLVDAVSGRGSLKTICRVHGECWSHRVLVIFDICSNSWNQEIVEILYAQFSNGFLIYCSLVCV